jgi:molecular chaperone DnaJ
LSVAYRDYYNILAVSKRATQVEIKQAYRELARQWHPDRNPGNPGIEGKFKELNEAYATLGDPDQRARYDRLGPLYTENGRPPRPEEVNAALGGLVGRLFRRKKAPPKGGTLRYTLSIDLEDTLSGVQHILTIPRKKKCGLCKGDGADPDGGRHTCSTCGGSGFSKTSRLFKASCYHCSGKGFQTSKPCPECQGDGVLGQEDQLKVSVPPGVATGQKLRLQGQGDASKGTGEAGDLLVIVSVREHALFRRRGQDLLVDMPLTFSEITNGCEMKVPTLDGHTTIRIPSGTRPGHVFRLSGKGLPSATQRGRGDLHLTAQLEVPQGLSPTQKQQLSQFFDSLPAQSHPNRVSYAASLRERT